MMPDRTIEALELAMEVIRAIEDSDGVLVRDTPMPGTTMQIRAVLAAALASLKQQPVQMTQADLAKRMLAEVKEAGSETALAKRMGITRQSVSDVLSGRREAGPAILGYLHLRKITTVRFEHPMPEPKPEPKPRSERRQRAWDMLPRVQTEGASA